MRKIIKYRNRKMYDATVDHCYITGARLLYLHFIKKETFTVVERETGMNITRGVITKEFLKLCSRFPEELYRFTDQDASFSQDFYDYLTFAGKTVKPEDEPG